MRYSAAFADQLDSLGIWWPRGDGDSLRSASRAWADIATLLEEITRSLDAARQAVGETYRGEAAAALATLWAEWSGEPGYLADTVADCRRLATALADFGGDVDLAHATLVRLIESVLGDGGGFATPDDVEHLRSEADEIGDHLGHRADVRCRELCDIGHLRTREPDDRAAIDPTRVTWTDPGDPEDFTFLVTQPVDFGAGQGDIVSLVPWIPGDGPGGDPGAPGPDGPWGWDQVCSQPGCDHRACGGVAPGPCPRCGCTACSCAGGHLTGPPVWCPPPGGAARSDWVSGVGDVPGIDGVGGADGGAAADRDGVLGVGDDLAFAAGGAAVRISSPEVPASDSGDVGGLGALGGGGLGGVGIDTSAAFGEVDLDMAGTFDNGIPLGPLAAAGLAGAGLVAASTIPASGSPAGAPLPPPSGAAAAGRSGRMPFFPMMPMMGGASGDDGDEPKRRRARKPRWPS